MPLRALALVVYYFFSISLIPVTNLSFSSDSAEAELLSDHLTALVIVWNLLLIFKSVFFAEFLEVYNAAESTQIFTMSDATCCTWSWRFFLSEVSLYHCEAGRTGTVRSAIQEVVSLCFGPATLLMVIK